MLLLFLDFIRWYLRQQGKAADLGPLRVFDYITVRAGSALVFAFALSLIFGPWMIERLRALKAGQIIRTAKKEGAISLSDMHGKKAGTPTMGGLLILVTTLGSVLIFGSLDSIAVMLLVAMSLGFGAVGFWDDYVKIMKKNHLGLSPRGKILGQVLLAVILAFVLKLGNWEVNYAPTGTSGYEHLLIPFFKDLYPPIGYAFVFWVVIVMVSASNAVNLTDGLDGLAIGVTISSAMAFTIIAYMASRVDMSSYLFIPFVPGGGEIVVFGAALIGASLGFLWFNSHPAQVFMGDTGSMMLGGALGTMALLLKHEALLLLIGGVFAVEAMSVIIQVTSFRLTGKRVFRMSPLHHHFEKLGLHESKIIIRFWTISILLALFGLATLKLR